jgi:hypothetical protein
MSAKITGTLSGFLTDLAAGLDPKVARGAVRAGAVVIKDAAAELCRSEEVRDSLSISTRSEPGVATAKVQTKGPGAYIAPWLENGTDPHFISVDDAQSDGRTVRRINKLTKEGSLVIGGQFVGTTVHHPGATAHPFMRPAADQEADAAVAAMSAYVAERVTPAGLAEPAEPQDPDE